MDNPVVDLTNCDREPIHIPGKIQSHGFLVAVDKQNKKISYASENVKEKTGLEATAILEQGFECFLHKTGIVLLSVSLQQLFSFDAETNFDAVNPVLVEIKGEPHHLIVHASDENTLLFEFEPFDKEKDMDLHRLIGVSVSRILEGKTIKQILQNAAAQVREIIGYDRVMIYKFWEDGHGEVIAEDKSENLDAFMGLHYPATDIPKQARDLYLTNLTRIITNVHSHTSAIVTHAIEEDGSASPLDLTYSALRAVSPVHIQYLKNMSVTASFSVSLISHNQLWGLIACHNETPKFIDYKAREAAKLLGQILSTSLEYKDDEETKEATQYLRQSVDALAKHLQKDNSLPETFTNNKNLVLKTTTATGVAICFEGDIHTAGNTPGHEEIIGIINWLKENVSSQIFNTENLSQHYAPAHHFSNVASGLLACMLSKEMNEYILWFKPELIKTVDWAGNPQKPVEVNEKDGTFILTPRHSFSTWREQVKNTSESWSKGEISAVTKLREDVSYIINQKTNQVRQLNEKLKEAYEELDTFSFTISHDLKTPITSIKNYTEIILEEHSDLDDDIVRMLKRVLKSTDKMSLLIKEVLSYSRISRKEMQYEVIDMQQLVQDIVTELQAVYKTSHTAVEIQGLENLYADKTMIMQVFTNVIGNAIKYSQGASQPRVTVSSTVNGNDILYKISDNGIGIDVSFGSQIFEIFKRLDNVAQYEGSGVGLSIVKRIMEKHGAKIWYESEINAGTTFYLLFLNNKSGL